MLYRVLKEIYLLDPPRGLGWSGIAEVTAFAGVQDALGSRRLRRSGSAAPLSLLSGDRRIGYMYINNKCIYTYICTHVASGNSELTSQGGWPLVGNSASTGGCLKLCASSS